MPSSSVKGWRCQDPNKELPLCRMRQEACTPAGQMKDESAGKPCSGAKETVSQSICHRLLSHQVTWQESR